MGYGSGISFGGESDDFFFPIFWGSGVKYIVRLEEERGGRYFSFWRCIGGERSVMATR